ncbi:MAG TPA: prolyl oligopeptidase family serine peptidase [Euzebya sp.]|nr:prolyl oligopeptidase family serine peptidase [Euzebya sp.]
MTHPPTRRDDTTDTLHGTQVTDPYRWLEDQESAEVADWVAAQAAHADRHLSQLPQRDAIRAQLAAIWDHPRVGVPWRRGERWFQQRNTGLQEQSVLWTAPTPDAQGSVLLDPATLSVDGTVSLAGLALTPDGSRLAFGTSDGGSDWITWHVRDVATGADADDIVPWGKFSGAAWLHDGSGFYYGAFDAPAEGQELAATNRNHQLRFHRIGTDASEDVTVYARPDQPDWGFSPAITDDGRWLVVTVGQGTDPRSRIHLAPLTDGDPAAVAIHPWLDDFDAEYGVIGTHGDTMFVQTDLDAPAGRVLAIDAHDAGRRREVLAPADHPLLAVRYQADGHRHGARLLVVRMVDAVHRLSIHDMEGREHGVVDLPDLSSVTDITGRQHDHQVHLALSSFASSASIHRLDVHSLELALVRPADVRLPEVVTEHVMVDSTHGARVPMFLIRHADLPADGGNRTILYGYGGFNISLSPEFRLWWTTWLQRGGMIAVGCFRGGGEYGRAWHDDGRLATKPHTFDDALACARWLAGEGWSDTGWAQPANIAITGGSNGGLTATATMLRAPEAFGACVPEVGVLDLLRFHRFTIGWAWTSDFGDPDDPDDFPRIRAMSPYHTVLDRPGRYPATLVTTADRDDRVVPAHSFKFTAALQAAQTGDAPVLARIDTRTGHGAGTPTSKLIAARADVMAFLEAVLPGRAPVRGSSPLSATGVGT